MTMRSIVPVRCLIPHETIPRFTGTEAGTSSGGERALHRRRECGRCARRRSPRRALRSRPRRARTRLAARGGSKRRPGDDETATTARGIARRAAEDRLLRCRYAQAEGLVRDQPDRRARAFHLPGSSPRSPGNVEARHRVARATARATTESAATGACGGSGTARGDGASRCGDCGGASRTSFRLRCTRTTAAEEADCTGVRLRCTGTTRTAVEQAAGTGVRLR